MIEILCTGSLVGSACATSAWPASWIRDDTLLVRRDHARPAFGSGDDALDRALDLRHPDLREPVPRREQRGFVEQVREIGTGHARRATRDDVEVDTFGERLVATVHAQDPLAPLEIGSVDDDLAIESARAQQRGIEHVGPVRRRDEDHAGADVETVELDEQLVQRLLAFVVAAADARAALPADRVDLVDEDDRAPRGLRVLEQVAHARGADTGEHLDEVAPRHREERHTGLARDRAREQRLARAGRPVEQHALRDLGADLLEARRIGEEVLDLAELLDRFVETGDVGERARASGSCRQ